MKKENKVQTFEVNVSLGHRLKLLGAELDNKDPQVQHRRNLLHLNNEALLGALVPQLNLELMKPGGLGAEFEFLLMKVREQATLLHIAEKDPLAFLAVEKIDVQVCMQSVARPSIGVPFKQGPYLIAVCTAVTVYAHE